jgi:hypothetical protein
VLQICQERVAAQMGKYRVHIVGRSGNGAVDSFAGEQYQAFDFMPLTKRQQRRFACGVVGQVDKFVKGCGEKSWHGKKK